MLFSILEPSEISQQSKIFSYYYSRSLSLLVSSYIFYNNGKQAHSYSKPRLWFKSGLQLPGKIVIKEIREGNKNIYKNYIRFPCWIEIKISLKVRNLWLWSLWFGFVDLIWVWGSKRLLWIWYRLQNRFIFRRIRFIDQCLFTYRYVKETLVWPLSTNYMSRASPEVPLPMLNEGKRAHS